MKIIAGDQEIDWDLPKSGVQLKEVIREVEGFLFSVGKVPTSLNIDGEELSQEELAKREEAIVTGNEVLTFGVTSAYQMIYQNLDGAATANQELINQIQTFAGEAHSSEKTVSGDQLLGEMNHFFNFWFSMRELLPEAFARADFDGESFTAVLNNLKKLLVEIVAALEEKDHVLATDLLQYEVSPLVEQVAKGVPSLRKEVETLEEQDKQQTATVES